MGDSANDNDDDSNDDSKAMTTIPGTATTHATTIPPTILMIKPPLQLTTPTPVPTTVPTTISIPSLLNFSSLFGFDQRVSTLETKLSQLKQADHSAQLLESVKSQIIIMVDDLLSTRIGYAIRTTLGDRDDKDKNEDTFARSDRGLKKRKTRKDAEPTKGSKLKELFETTDAEIPQDQRGDMKDQPNVEATVMDDWFKKPNKPLTPDYPWNDGKFIDSTPPQKWISNIVKEQLSTFLKELIKALWNWNITLKTVTDQLDWNNPKGHEYSFDFSKPLLLIEAQGRQVVLDYYFFNNDLECLKGGSLSRKYITSRTKNKAAKCENIEGIKDMVLKLWSIVKVA
nr:hypothetical protein [Tanacetum cinerariifolium]